MLPSYFVMTVVGEKEQANGTVNVRTRDNKVHGEHSVVDVTRRFAHLQQSRSRNAEDDFAHEPPTKEQQQV